MYNKILKEIMSLRNEDKAKHLLRFFKTGRGDYGEGDLFLGIVVPESRNIAQKYSHLSLNDTSKLLKNKYHEVRLVALLILVHKYKNLSTKTVIKENKRKRKEIVDLYLANTKYINNWDLVDLSVHYIFGDYLYHERHKTKTSHRSDRWLGDKILNKLIKSENLWERRIAVISTFAFIYKGESWLTLEIVEKLMKDKHDLIHKACGWMLREVGKRVSERDLCLFLDKHINEMPRTMLRYSIERLPEQKRKYYLKKK